jgi:hypothetical protein
VRRLVPENNPESTQCSKSERTNGLPSRPRSGQGRTNLGARLARPLSLSLLHLVFGFKKMGYPSAAASNAVIYTTYSLFLVFGLWVGWRFSKTKGDFLSSLRTQSG